MAEAKHEVKASTVAAKEDVKTSNLPAELPQEQPKPTKSFRDRIVSTLSKLRTGKTPEQANTPATKKLMEARGDLLIARVSSINAHAKYTPEQRHAWRYELEAMENGVWYPGMPIPKSKAQQVTAGIIDR